MSEFPSAAVGPGGEPESAAGPSPSPLQGPMALDAGDAATVPTPKALGDQRHPPRTSPRLVLAFSALTFAVAAALGVRGCHRPMFVIDIDAGGDIQADLDAVARRPGKGTVRVHPGTYRPSAPGQAFIVFNARHDGVRLEGVGEVVLTAANSEIADPEAPSYPAAVNHVV